MKIFFIASSVYVIYLMKMKFKATYDPGLDTFKIEYLALFAGVLSVLLCHEYTVVEVRKRVKEREREAQTNGLHFVNRFFGPSQFG